MSNPWLQGVDPLGELYHLVDIDRLLQVNLIQYPRLQASFIQLRALLP